MFVVASGEALKAGEMKSADTGFRVPFRMASRIPAASSSLICVAGAERARPAAPDASAIAVKTSVIAAAACVCVIGGAPLLLLLLLPQPMHDRVSSTREPAIRFFRFINSFLLAFELKNRHVEGKGARRGEEKFAAITA
jgi:hypothetical protein